MTRAADVDRLCEELFLGRQARRQDSNLLFVRERLLRSGMHEVSGADLAGLLELYGRALRGRRARDDDNNRLVEILKLSGIVRASAGWLRVRNRVYGRVFNHEWVASQMPDAEVRRQRAAYRRGLMRAASAAALIVAMMTGLALSAMSNAHQAQAATAEAVRTAQTQRRLAARLEVGLRNERDARAKLEQALVQARTERKRADRLTRQARAAEGSEYQQRQRAEIARHEAVEQGTHADRERRRALASRTEAVRQREQSRQRLVTLNVASGMRLVDQGDLLGSLPWFAEALTLDRGHPARERIDRARLAFVLDQCPKLAQAWLHPGRIDTAVFSPDGLRVLTTCQDRDNAARIWDVRTGQLLTPPMRHRGLLRYALFSPDGRRVVTVSGSPHDQEDPKNSQVQVWDAATGQPLSPAIQPGCLVDLVAFSPDGRRLAIGTLTASGAGGEVQLRDAATGRLLTGPNQPRIFGKEVAFSPDGRSLMTCGGGIARVWDATTGEPISPIFRPAGRRARFSPDGRRVVTWDVRFSARVWDVATGKLAAPPLEQHATVDTAAFSPDGRRIVTACQDGTARVWDAMTGRPVTALLKHGEGAVFASFSPDGGRVLTSGGDTARVWDATTGEPVTPPLRQNGGIRSAAFSPDGQQVLTAGADGLARIWNLVTDQPTLAAEKPADWLNAAVFSPDGRRFATADWAGTARVWNAGTGEPVTPPLIPGGPVRQVAFSPDGRRVVTASRDGTARVWDATTGRPLAPPMKHPDPVQGAAFSPDGRRIVTSSSVESDDPRLEHGQAQVWDAATGQPLTPPMRVSRLIQQASFSPEGRRVLIVCFGLAQVWDARTGRPLTPRRQPSGRRVIPVFSPDGRRFVAAGPDQAARVWDAATGRPLTPPMNHRDYVGAAFSPDGRRIVTSGPDRMARVWNAGTGRPLTPPMLHRGPVGAAFSPDGRWVVTTSRTGANGGARVQVWDAATGELVTVAPFRVRGFVAGALFSPDSRRLLITSADEAPRIWDLPREDGLSTDLSRLARVLSGQRVDGTGSLAPLETAELAGDWRALRQQQPVGFAVSPEKLLAWHRSELDALEDATNWSAALPHLDRLMAAYPREASLYVRRAEARAELGQWENARADGEKAIALGAGGPTLSDHLALVQLALGDTAAYRAACARRFDCLGPAPGPDGINQAARALALLPGAAPAAERFEALLQKAVTAQPDSREAQSNLGALLYRAGRYPESMERLRKVAADEDEEAEVQTRAYAGLFLAMCHQRLGHAPEARQALAAAVRLSEQALQPKPAAGESQWVAWPYPRWTGAPPPWWERLPLQLLRREAEALINPTQPAAGR